MIFDSDLMFAKREYSYFGASMYRIRIHEPLASIMIQPLLYVRDMVPKHSFDCLSKIFQVPSTFHVWLSSQAMIQVALKFSKVIAWSHIFMGVHGTIS